MKNLTRIAIIVLPPLLAMIYLFYGNGLELITSETGGEAPLVGLSLPEENGGIQFHIDKTMLEDVNGKQLLHLNGWVFRENAGSKRRKVYLVLKSEKEELVFKVHKNDLRRADVKAAYHLQGTNDRLGFEVLLPVRKFQESLYKIGFILEDESGKNFSLTRKLLKITNDSVTLTTSDQPSEKGKVSFSQAVDITLKKSTTEVACCFDQVEVKDSVIMLTGWGFLKGLDDKILKTYILLRQEEKVLIFSVIPRERKDVTRAFSQYQLRLDSTGFRARIPVALLKRGSYRVGLYLVKGQDRGVFYTVKTVTVGE